MLNIRVQNLNTWKDERGCPPSSQPHLALGLHTGGTSSRWQNCPAPSNLTQRARQDQLFAPGVNPGLARPLSQPAQLLLKSRPSQEVTVAHRVKQETGNLAAETKMA